MSPLAQQILAYMGERPPVQQLYRLQELQQLGSPAEVNQALQELALAHRAGSPGPGLWFPLRPVQDALGTFHMPPAFLKEMAESLLQREGVGVRQGLAVQNYHLAARTGGREGVWGTPTFQQIGVDQPVTLNLHWHDGYVYTEYQGTDMMPNHPPPFSATTIEDAGELARRAEQMQTSPARLEKDIWVNAALVGLSEAPPSDLGQFLFMGGTSLTKAFRLVPRFSEDIDLRFQLHEAAFPGTFASMSTAVYHDLRARIVHHVLPRIPGAHIDEGRSILRPQAQLHALHVRYPSAFDPEGNSLIVEAMIKPWRVPWDYRAIQNYPGTMTHQATHTLCYLPCVPIWGTMTGKLQALAMYAHTPAQRDMRHLVDLGAWLSPERDTGDIHAYMVQQSLGEESTRHLLDWLEENLQILRKHPGVPELYATYVRAMFPGNLAFLAPPLYEALDRIEALWHAMCDADWENPRYRVEIPHFRDVPLPTAALPPRPADTARLRRAADESGHAASGTAASGTL